MRKWRSEELEQIVCDFCGGRDSAREFIRGDGMRVTECSQCGLAFLNPRPKTAFIERFYGADYFTGVSADKGEGGLHCSAERTTNNSQDKHLPRPMWILENKFKGIRGKKVLEIGCATGDLLLALKERGAQVKGVEISDFAASVARCKDIDVITGTIEDFVVDHSEKYDIVIALQVVEHVPNPTQFFHNIAHLLKEGGVLLLSTPNYSCVKRFGPKWFGFNASYEHLYFFSLQILKKIGIESGLHLKYIESSQLITFPEKIINFYEQLIQKKNTLLYVVREIGFAATLETMLKKSSGYYSFAIGHIMTIVFEKKPRSHRSVVL